MSVGNLFENATEVTRTDLVAWGCAPGGYIYRCHTCQCGAIGAKRRWCCEPCAIIKEERYWDHFFGNHKGTD